MRRQRQLWVHRQMNAYQLCYEPTGSPQLFYADHPQAAHLEPLPREEGCERYVRLPGGPPRPYFLLRREGAPDLWAADAAVEIPVVENFRDLGGYLNHEGRAVRWGRFFRSGTLHGLGEDHRRTLAALRLRYVLDFRSEWEAQRVPDEVDSDTQYYQIPAIGPGNPKIRSLAEMDLFAQLRERQSPQDLRDVHHSLELLYQELPFDNPAYRCMLETLDHLDQGAMLQHCSAGKDRTGIGCALLLLALGVSETTVMEDYLLSSIFREEHNRVLLARVGGMGLKPETVEAMRRMMDVHQDLLGHTFTAIRARYDGFDRYFLEEYGVSADHLADWRQRHTVPVEA